MNYLEDERDRVLENPSYSVADAQDAEAFVLTHKGRWKAKVLELARGQEAALTQKKSETYAKIRDEQRGNDADQAALNAGQIDHLEFLARRNLRLGRVSELERRYDGLVSAQALIDTMRSDPVGWMDAFYKKWKPLQDRRPSIDLWIEEARRKRQSK